jgi:hypothetical protein
VDEALEKADKALGILDHATKAGDRWMFIALLFIGILAVIFLVRYFMSEIGKLQIEIVNVRGHFEESLKEGNEKMVAALTRSSEVIARNNQVLERLTERLDQR